MTSDAALRPCSCNDNDCSRLALPGQLFCRLCLDGRCDAVRDIQTAGPSDCLSCAFMSSKRACIEHTCPDCNSITHGLRNHNGELVHSCPV